MTPPHESLIDDVHAFRIKPIEALNNDLIRIPDARTHKDLIIRECAQKFGNNAFIYDFRQAKPGDGFDMLKLKGISRHDNYSIYTLEPRPSIISKITRRFKNETVTTDRLGC